MAGLDVVALSYRDAAHGLRTGLVDAVPNLAELAPLVARALDTEVRLAPYVLGDDAPGAFDGQRWHRTVARLEAVHDLARGAELALS